MKGYRKYKKTRNKVYSLLAKEDSDFNVMEAIVDTITDVLDEDAIEWVKNSLKVKKEIDEEENEA